MLFEFFSTSCLNTEDLWRRLSAVGEDDLVQGLMETSLWNFSCFRGVAKSSTVKALELRKDSSTSSFGRQLEDACIIEFDLGS